MHNRVNAYRETEIKTAGQGKLIVMLYDEAIKQLGTAIHGLENETKELDKVNASIIRAQDMVTELSTSLDFERGGDIAHNLFSLYMYFNSRLLEGNIRKDVAPLKEIRSHLSSLREAWSQISKTVSMENHSPSVGGVNIAG
ncbi:MAG: flagellar export chaperone FliS [Spirochaetales bacterium]|nr:flagellar export chaperone FliS [Spirochaetales bacterium]